MIIFAAYLVTLYVIYQYSLREKLQSNDSKQVDLDTSTINTTKVEDRSIIHALINVLMGFVLLIGLSVFLALFAPILSEDYGISQYVLGLTVIGIGTSLPMIITSAKSALKGYVDIILGNVFGSTIANMALGIGLPAMIKPLSFNKEAVSDVYFFSILNTLVVFCILIEMKLLGGHNALNRVSGILIIMFYLGYLVVRIV